MKSFVYTIVVIVVIAIVAGFFIVGSPATERQRRFDQQRTNDLNMIQSFIIDYWTSKNFTLPQSLEQLNDETRGVIVPNDPQTDADYEYIIKGANHFELCAAFNLPSMDSPNIAKTAPSLDYYGRLQNWSHDAGRVCFDRPLDKDFYKQPIR